MNLFAAWMKKEKITAKELSHKTSLNLKTITKLRKIEDESRVQLGTLIKLKEGYGDLIDLSSIFISLKKF